MARKHGVTTKYNPAIAYSSQSIQADMQESKEGRYVELKDYENALGVIRKLKTKLAKKERRSVQLKKAEVVEPTYLTLEEKKNVQVGEVYKITGMLGGYRAANGKQCKITQIYDRAGGDFGFNFVVVNDNIVCKGIFGFVIGSTTLQGEGIKMERVK